MKNISSNSRLYTFSLFLSGLTLLLILAGGLVTSHQAGLAVPDWPLSYGKFFPPMVGNVFWEHGHRMIAGSVGILTIIFAIWTQLQEKRKWIKRLAWIAVLAVVLQATLGGLTVLYMLPPAVSIFHACLAQTFFNLVVAITYFLSPQFNPSPLTFSPQAGRGGMQQPSIPLSPLGRGQGEGKLFRLSLMTTGFIYLQLILGAVIRHTGYAVIPHIIVAFLVGIHVMLVVLRVMRSGEYGKSLERLAIALGLITVVQFFLGMGSFIFTRMLQQGYAPSTAQIYFTAAHQTTGAVILALSVLISLMAWR